MQPSSRLKSSSKWGGHIPQLRVNLAVSILSVVSLLNPSLTDAHNHNHQWHTQTALERFDFSVSSSSLGEPVFRLEPPARVVYPNQRGVTLSCLASGDPRPTIVWYSTTVDRSNGADVGVHFRSRASALSMGLASEGGLDLRFNQQPSRAVRNVTNLVEIIHDGSVLRLLPFNETDLEPEIHYAEYRCVASNNVATIHSRPSLVQPVVTSTRTGAEYREMPSHQIHPKIHVADQFVTLGSNAVLRCRLSGQPPEVGDSEDGSRFELIEWFVSDGLRISPLDGGDQDIGGGSDSSGGSGLAGGHTDSEELAENSLKIALTGQQAKRTVATGNSFTSTSSMINAGSATGTSATTSFTSTNNQPPRLVAFKSGHLHIGRVESRDLQRTYGCRARLTGSGQILSSGGRAQLVALADGSAGRQSSDQFEPPLHSVSKIVHLSPPENQPPSSAIRGQVNSKIVIPCATSNSGPLSWFVISTTSIESTSLSSRQLPLDQWASQMQILQLNGGLNRSTNGVDATSGGSYSARLLQGATYLLLETLDGSVGPLDFRLSGRFLARPTGGGNGALTSQSNVCDTEVILSRPIRAQIQLMVNRPNQSSSSAATALELVRDQGQVGGSQDEQQLEGQSRKSVNSNSIKFWFSSWFGRSERNNSADNSEVFPRRSVGRSRRQNKPNQPRQTTRPIITVSGPALIKPPTRVSAGRIQLDCLVTGFPLLPPSWIHQGQPVEPASPPRQEAANQLISSLVVELELSSAPQVFECFGSNSLADSWRAAKIVVASSQSSTLDRMGDDRNANQNQEDVEGGSDENHHQRSTECGTRDELLALEGSSIDFRCRTNSLDSSQVGLEWRKFTDAELAVGSIVVDQQQDVVTPRPSNQIQNELPVMINEAGIGNSGSSSQLTIKTVSKRHHDATYMCLATPPVSSDRSSVSLADHGCDLLDQALATNFRSAGPSPIIYDSIRLRVAVSLLTLLCDTTRQIMSGISTSVIDTTMTELPAYLAPLTLNCLTKPRIDAFEFSRNLEESMRTVLVCALTSGQQPVQIVWFKDGELLLDEPEGVSVSLAGDHFSSSLTFFNIRAQHSGLYSCVASNGFASAHHSSRLLVNVAPYFLEPPKSSDAVLGSDVLLRCRAGGQPAPQVRWRKMIASAGQTSGFVGRNPAPSDHWFSTGNEATSGLQMTQVQREFRQVSSNAHIQVLENGSMLIRDLELSDASRYACQASNGISPAASQLIELRVLSPARFESSLEQVAVKRGSVVRFRCQPAGDQPLRLQWRKESQPLVALPATGGQQPSSIPQIGSTEDDWKYTELIRLANSSGSSESGQLRHNRLVLGLVAQAGVAGSNGSGIYPSSHSNHPLDHSEMISQTNQLNNNAPLDQQLPASHSSELVIAFAERGDSGSFTCHAHNPFGSDRLVYRLLVQEPPDAPAELRLEAASASTLRLAWTPPFDGHLAISHYVLEFRARRSGKLELDRVNSAAVRINRANEVDVEGWSRLVLASSSSSSSSISSRELGAQNGGGTATSSSAASLDAIEARLARATIRQLHPRTAYLVRIAAVNGAGQGAFSSQLHVWTSELAPGSPPSELRVSPSSSNSLRVTWRPTEPIDERAPVKGYQVSHRRLDSAADWMASGSVSSLANATNVYVASDRKMAQLDKNQPPSRIAESSGSLNLNQEFQLTIGGLQRDTKYEVRVQPFNSVGVGPSSEAVGQTLSFDRPGAPSLRLVGARRQALELAWTMPSSSSGPNLHQGPLLGFVLYFRCERDDWQELQLALMFAYLLEGLRCGTRYQLYLVAHNQVGRGEPSEVVAGRTEGTSPQAPEKQQLVQQVNSSEVQLDLASWSSGGCPISSFIVQFKRLHEPNWFILGQPQAQTKSDTSTSSNLKSHQSELFQKQQQAVQPTGSRWAHLNDLEPGQWYKLLVTANNEAGSTDAEYLFSTLTLDGQPAAPPPYLSGEQLGIGTGGGLSSTTSSQGIGRSFLGFLSSLLWPSSVVGSADRTGSEQPLTSGLLLPIVSLLMLTVTIAAAYAYFGSESNHNRKRRNADNVPVALTSSSSISGSSNGCGGSGPSKPLLSHLSCSPMLGGHHHHRQHHSHDNNLYQSHLQHNGTMMRLAGGGPSGVTPPSGTALLLGVSHPSPPSGSGSGSSGSSNATAVTHSSSLAPSSASNQLIYQQQQLATCGEHPPPPLELVDSLPVPPPPDCQYSHHGRLLDEHLEHQQYSHDDFRSNQLPPPQTDQQQIHYELDHLQQHQHYQRVELLPSQQTSTNMSSSGDVQFQQGSASSRLIGSSSFASGADLFGQQVITETNYGLAEHNQSNQRQCEGPEPLYQRLGGARSGNFRSHTLRLSGRASQALVEGLVRMQNEHQEHQLKSMTLRHPHNYHQHHHHNHNHHHHNQRSQQHYQWEECQAIKSDLPQLHLQQQQQTQSGLVTEQQQQQQNHQQHQLACQEHHMCL